MRVVSQDEHALTTMAGGFWLMAAELVRHHGEKAPSVAARRARSCLEVGALKQRLEWLRIMAATRALLEEDDV